MRESLFNHALPILVTATDDEQALFAAAAAIRAWQQAQGLSNMRLIRQFPALGSDKTYGKLLKGDADQLNVAEWLPRYRGVQLTLEHSNQTASADPLYRELGTACGLLLSVASLLQQSGNDRVIILEGDSGSGKTCALRLVEQAHPGTVVRVEANESWKSLNAMLADLLLATGAVGNEDSLMPGVRRRLAVLVAHLRQKRLLVAIDESHHMTAAGINTVKTLVNETPGWFILAGQSTLWRKLQATAWQEAKQVRHNRCHDAITFGAPDAGDVQIYTTRRAGPIDGATDGLWRALTDLAAHHGGYAFLRDAIKAGKAQEPRDATSLSAGSLLAGADRIKARASGR